LVVYFEQSFTKKLENINPRRGDKFFDPF